MRRNNTPKRRDDAALSFSRLWHYSSNNKSNSKDKSSKSSRSISIFKNIHHHGYSSSSANGSLVLLLLSISILLWISLCCYIHLQLSNNSENFEGGSSNSNRGGYLRFPSSRLMISNPQQQHNVDDNQVVEPTEPLQQSKQQQGQSEEEEEEEGISACLLVNDENPRLPEWIAYHYYMLPLRSLIVTIDPASRSSPSSILNRWKRTMNLDVKLWSDLDFMPLQHINGICNQTDPNQDCLMQHRKRQQHFVRACMKDLKRRGKKWVLLTDVDEYITFNTIHDEYETLTTTPLPVLDEAPMGVPMIYNWTWNRKVYYNEKGKRITGTFIEGNININENILPRYTMAGFMQIDHHPRGTKTIQHNYTKNGERMKTPPLINSNDEIFYGAYGSVFTDNHDQKWYLRNNYVYRDALDVTIQDAIEHGKPIINGSYVQGNVLYGTVVNASLWNKNENNEEEEEESGMTKYKDGQAIEIKTNWREPSSSSSKIKTIHGGHTIKSIDGKVYYVIRDTYLKPPYLSTDQLVEIRKRLPKVGEGITLLDVIQREMSRFSSDLGEEYVNETFGPCLSLPRLLYGSVEHPSDRSNASPSGFNDTDYVTLRFRYHSLPDNRINKYQKALIDTSRIPLHNFNGEAENIHTPIHHYCRKKQPPRYTTSFFRVNHYLDSYESYSYRNDARSDKKNCHKCYLEKGREAHKQNDDDIRPWLVGFVKSVGYDTAKTLLEGAGGFLKLPDPIHISAIDTRKVEEERKKLLEKIGRERNMKQKVAGL